MAIEKKRALEVKKAPVLDKKLKAPKIEKPRKKKVVVQEVEEPKKSNKPVTVGARVRIPGHSKTGVVQSLKGKQAEVLVGNFNVRIKITDLEVVQ